MSAPRAWVNFVDRFLGLMIHVVNHTARTRGLPLDDDTRDDLVAEIFAVIVADKYAVLRRFQKNCSLATYLSVIARRIAVRRLMTRSPATLSDELLDQQGQPDRDLAQFEDAEEVERLLTRLSPNEAQVVRMYHLEGLSYQEISRQIGIQESSIGPVLSRARNKMRQVSH
jgi:RNA polymerase sigma-70 factor (ECF subfamily)